MERFNVSTLARRVQGASKQSSIDSGPSGRWAVVQSTACSLARAHPHRTGVPTATELRSRRRRGHPGFFSGGPLEVPVHCVKKFLQNKQWIC